MIRGATSFKRPDEFRVEVRLPRYRLPLTYPRPDTITLHCDSQERALEWLIDLLANTIDSTVVVFAPNGDPIALETGVLR